MFIVASDLSEIQRERLTSTLSLRGMNVPAYALEANSVCGIVLHAEKLNGESFSPSKWTRRQYEQDLHHRRLF